MNEVKVKLVRVNNKNLKAVCSAIAVGGILMFAGAAKAASSTPLPLRNEHHAVHIHNGVTSQTIEAAYGTNLQGLAFTKTTTYDFYSQPLSAVISLTPGGKVGGKIRMQNNGTDGRNDFSVTGRMQFFDYDPATGRESLILDTTASDANRIKHGETASVTLPKAQAPRNLTIAAGHLIHIAMTLELVSGEPGNFAQVLYNGPRGVTTVAYFPKESAAGLGLAPILAAIPLPTNSIMSFLPNHSIRITSRGVPGASCLIQATTDLSKPASWVTISTNVVGLDGVLNFIDGDATNHACRFYRFAAP